MIVFSDVKVEWLSLHFLPEKTALVCSVDAAVIEPVQKPAKDIWEW